MDYKKILEGVVDIINTAEKSDIGFANICTYIGKNCPELKESEDERIRMSLIELFKDMEWDDSILHDYNMDKDKTIAWLEKQCEQKSNEVKPKFKIGDIVRHKDNPHITYVLKRFTDNGDYEFHAIGKDGTEGGTNFVVVKYQDEWELVEQKPTGKIESKFKIEKGKWYVCIKDLLDNYANKAFRKGDTYLSTQDGSLIPSNSNIPFEVVCPDTYFRDWTIQDAKAGDVLVASDGSIFIFKEVVDLGCKHYIALEEEDGTIQVNDKFAHYWESVSGACPATKEQRDTLEKAMADSGWAFDFEKKELKKIENETEIPFGAKDSELQEVTYFIPKGFHAEIDDDKVVIKKGEKPADKVKPKFKHGDTIHKIGENTIYPIKIEGITGNNGSYIGNNGRDFITIKFQDEYELIEQNHTEWSEEDEMMIKFTLTHFRMEGATEDSDIIKWLKSIKDRYTWKPSEEQMKALNYVVNLMASSKSPNENDYYYNVFKNLRKQLKKLMEE